MTIVVLDFICFRDEGYYFKGFWDFLVVIDRGVVRDVGFWVFLSYGIIYFFS